jgi:hypothetical protein
MNAHLQRTAWQRRLPLACCLAVAIAGPASADAVVDWNATYDQAAPAFGGPPQRVYLGAMMHIAIHDALNSIDRRYETYTVVSPTSHKASPNAAIAAAAHDVLINQLSRLPETPEKAAARATVEARYVAALAAIPDCLAKRQGIAAGRAAAASIIALRRGDGSDTPNLPYTLAPGRGVYQPTAPNFAPPANAGWALVKPFAMTRNSQFRSGPSPIFDLTSDAYARDYNEVKQVGDGRVRAARPDSERSRIARFWPGGGADWEAVTRTIAADRHLNRWQHARLFALLDMAEADAAISVFDTKYRYNFWRPVTAIHWVGDGNARTASDPDWLPYLVTPPFPDYTCGLPTISGAATAVLRNYFRTDAVPYTLTVTIPRPVPLAPETLTRSYATLSQATAEAADARVFAGIHFRTGCVQGVRQGGKVGAFVFQNFLRPLR